MFDIRKHLLVVLIVGSTSAAQADGLASFCRNLFDRPKSFVEQELKVKEERVWEKIRPHLRQEMDHYRSLNKQDQSDYLLSVSEQVTVRLKQVFQINEIGFHYNLHGGLRESYLTSGGILANRGDIATQLGHGADYAPRVYLFQSQHTSLYQVLNTANPSILFPRFRMGQVLMLINLEAPALKRLEADGVLVQREQIFLEYNEKSDKAPRTKNGSIIGVPSEAFLLPPLEVFHQVAQRSGIRRPSWNEQTLITLRFIEAMAEQSKAEL